MKERLKDLLARRELDEIARMAAAKRRVLGALTSLTFDADPLIAWRAVEATGVAAARVAEDSPESVRNHLRRLHWLLSEESGGICWHSPQSMAEIVRRSPADFSDYAPVVVTLLDTMAEEDLGHFRAAVLWAIGRLATVAADVAESVLPSITASLDDPDPQVRGMAVWCLVQLDKRELIESRADLLDDEGVVELYEDGQLERTTVGALAAR